MCNLYTSSDMENPKGDHWKYNKFNVVTIPAYFASTVVEKQDGFN